MIPDFGKVDRICPECKVEGDSISLPTEEFDVAKFACESCGHVWYSY